MSLPIKPLRGFAALKARDPERLKAISVAAGKRAHAIGHARVFTPAEAKDARAAQVKRGVAFIMWCDARAAEGNPCRRDRRCFETHRCPFDPVCNN